MTASTFTSAFIIGSTGLVGSHILSSLLNTATYKTVNTITRHTTTIVSPSLNAVVNTDTATWAETLSNLNPPPETVWSALGTTRSAAGSIANQWEIDHDLNIELAKTAKASGARTFVFISSARSHTWYSDYVPLFKMKKGVENAIKELDFEHGIIVKPGLLFGPREHVRAGEALVQTVAGSLGKLSPGLQDSIGQGAEVVARAAIKAAQIAGEGKAPAKFWVVESDEILRLGRAA